MKYKRGKQGTVEWEVIAWIIALAVLAFAIVMAIILRKQGFDLIEQIKNFLRFGR